MAAKLAAAGVAAVTLDPAANVPYVLVGPARVVSLAGGIGAWRSEILVRIVWPPPGDAATLAALEDGLEAVLRTLGPALADDGTYLTGGKDCPAYTVTYLIDVPNPDC
jgi:hypothetical protein